MEDGGSRDKEEEKNEGIRSIGDRGR